MTVTRVVDCPHLSQFGISEGESDFGGSSLGGTIAPQRTPPLTLKSIFVGCLAYPEPVGGMWQVASGGSGRHLPVLRNNGVSCVKRHPESTPRRHEELTP